MFNIVPQPVSILINQDKKGFTLHTGTIISPYPFVDEFISFVRKILNKKVYVHEDTGEERSIILKIDDSIEHNEGYTIKCENRRVFINAKTETGLFYGLQTLKQMLLQTEGKLPYTEITDYPRYSHRGLTLDCEHSNCSIDTVKHIIDMMAFHKMNVLRWCYEDNYSKAEIEKIVAYCNDRQINVISDNDDITRINRSKRPYCIDYPYGVNTLKNVCNSHGAPLTDEIVGVEATIRTKIVPNMKKLEYHMFPRLGAVAENCWSDKGYSSFSIFVHKAVDYNKFLDAYDVNYAPLKKACPSFVNKQASRIYFKLFRNE